MTSPPTHPKSSSAPPPLNRALMKVMHFTQNISEVLLRNPAGVKTVKCSEGLCTLNTVHGRLACVYVYINQL